MFIPHTARFGIFFGNKSNSSLANFSTEITVPPESKTDIHNNERGEGGRGRDGYTCSVLLNIVPTIIIRL